MLPGREKRKATVARKTLERNSGQQIDLGYEGHVCQPEN